MRFTQIVFSGLLALGCLNSELKAQKTKKDPILLQFSNASTPDVKFQGAVTKSEFEYVYQKNNGGWDAAKNHKPEQYREYLDLYIKFKRKVFAAEAAGIDTTTAFKSELATYTKQLAQPYLVEKDVVNHLMIEAYERMQYLVHASHLLIKVNADALPADTLKAYNRIMAIRDSIIKKTITFEDAVRNNSEDPSAATNLGDLGYFSAFDMVYPFETGAYTTPVNSVSMPIRSQFGYHLIYVHDKIKNTGTKRVSHIMIRYGEQYTSKTSEDAQKRINEVYEALKKGDDFNKLCSVYSDDPMTAKKNGDLGTGFLLKEMTEQKVKLGLNEFSKPFQTAYGWHILKVTELTPIKSFEEMKAELKGKVGRDSRAKISENKLIERLKKEYSYAENTDGKNAFLSALKEDYLRTIYKGDSLDKNTQQTVLFSFLDGKQKVEKTVYDFIVFLQTIRRNPKGDVKTLALEEIEKFTNKVLLDFEETQLERKYPDYKLLLKEYRDGILLFTLTEQTVWKKAVEDTLGLKNFYERNKSKYNWAADRVKIKEYRSKDETNLEFITNLYQSGKSGTEVDSIARATIKDGDFRITENSVEKGANPAIDPFFTAKPGLQNLRKDGDFFVLTFVKEVLPKGPKSFEEAKSECISQYQSELEKNWIADLEKKYPVVINEKTFSRLYK